MNRSRMLQRVIANQSSASPLLDQYSGAIAAYSLRYLSGSFTGDVVLVRRSSDNAEQGFMPTEITDGTLVSFCGAGDGLIKTWYDQSGSVNNATQSSASLQPRIVTSGSLNAENGNPTITFNGTSYLNGVGVSSPQDNTFFIVCNKTDHTGYLYDGAVSRQAQGNNDWIFAGSVLSNAYPSVNLGNQVLFTAIYKTTSEAFINGLQTVSGDAGTGSLDELIIGARTIKSDALTGNIQEFIIYPSDKSISRSEIESDINNHYNVF